MREWQPIETAPKDGTCVDIWMVDEDSNGWREADARYVIGYEDERPVWEADQQSFRYYGERYKRDGWFAPNHDYDGQDGWCDKPEYFNPHPRQNKLTFKRATHWMPLPAPPVRLVEQPVSGGANDG